MNMKKIEVKVLALGCILFWIMQLLGENQEGKYLFVLSAIAIVLIILETLNIKANRLCLYTVLFQIVSLFIMRLFRVAKTTGLFNSNENKNMILELLLILILFGVLFVLNKRSVWFVRKKKINLVYVVMFVGFFIREAMCYIGNQLALQNDVGTFTKGNNGHLGYIYQLYKYMSLPKGSPVGQYQFYHPPLHHFVSSLWAKLNSFLGVPEERIGEMLQVLSLFYSMMIIILAYKIMKEITKNKRSLLSGVVLVTFFPYLIEYAGALNNDPLCYVLSLMTILYFIRWYKKSTYKNIILCGVCMGCAMMTKMSAAMLAPAMAIMFVYKLVKERTKLLEYIKQYVCFGLVSIPLGMWFPLRNMILYKIPFNYVTEVPKESAYNIRGDFSAWSRLFGVSIDQFKSLYLTVTKGAEGYVHNIGIAVTKSATFGESDYFSKSDYSALLGTWMYRGILVLSVLSIVCLVLWFVKYKKNKEVKLFLLLTIVINIASFVWFQFQYPATPSMNARYVITVAVLQMCIIGASSAYFSKKKEGNALVMIFKVFLVAYALINTVGTLSLLYTV